MVGNILRLALVLLMSFLTSSEDASAAEEYNFNFRIATETSGATSYIFEGKYPPPLNLIGGEYADHRSVNKVLAVIPLPEVSRDARERSKITGSRYDRQKYIWKGHLEGRDMVLYGSLCRNQSHENYDCIWKILIATD